MALPLSYPMRNIAVRRASAAFTALGIAMTVAVFAGIISLREGFKSLYALHGRQDIAIYLRPGSTSEGESGIRREEMEILLKERPEVATDAEGRRLAAAESFLAVYMDKVDGGVTNVPLRGVQPMSMTLLGDTLRLVDGRWMEFGTDEVVVGRPLTERMANCRIGDTLVLNTTPFQVVGVFEQDGYQGGEVWGDVERMMTALERPMYQRVIAQLVPGTDVKAVAEDLKEDERTPMDVHDEQSYLAKQTTLLEGTLSFLAIFLSIIMGLAAVLGAINTMLAAVASRTHEIGVLLAIGYSRFSVFVAFLAEAALIGLIGGALGILIALPFHGLETGVMNWNTFTDVSFAFRVTPMLVLQSFFLAFLLGLVGGTLPALRAARLKPVEAFRQH